MNLQRYGSLAAAVLAAAVLVPPPAARPACSDAAGLAAILLPEFGTLGEEGAEGASGLAERVGAAAALMTAAGDGAPPSLMRISAATSVSGSH